MEPKFDKIKQGEDFYSSSECRVMKFQNVNELFVGGRGGILQNYDTYTILNNV